MPGTTLDVDTADLLLVQGTFALRRALGRLAPASERLVTEPLAGDGTLVPAGTGRLALERAVRVTDARCEEARSEDESA